MFAGVNLSGRDPVPAVLLGGVAAFWSPNGEPLAVADIIGVNAIAAHFGQRDVAARDVMAYWLALVLAVEAMAATRFSSNTLACRSRERWASAGR